MRIYRAKNTVIYAFEEIIKFPFRFQCGQSLNIYIPQKRKLFWNTYVPLKGRF